jgi:hypothetical protein
VEHRNWLKRSLSNDEFGKVLLGGSLSERVVDEWAKDPLIVVDDRMQSIFDTLENLDATECCLKARALAGTFHRRRDRAEAFFPFADLLCSEPRGKVRGREAPVCRGRELRRGRAHPRP